ncbi:SRPBCC family protein [Sphingobacterium suaedae]|uniref:Cell division inhibitor n=1 Tax=Sphingobacterium suaedae TaxID=1686402 RepID=A0ABW5KBT4_9SPHI
MKIYVLERTQHFNCSIEEAWSFFTDPHNLAAITPEDLNFRILGEWDGLSIYRGMIINYDVSPLFGIRMRWQTEITQVEYQRNFIDYQRKGPYRFWEHIHEFVADEKGIVMKDTVRYALPFGFIGRMVHRWIVRKRLNKVFDYRYAVLDDLLNYEELDINELEQDDQTTRKYGK